MNNLENEKTILEEKLMQKMKQAKYYKAKYKDAQEKINKAIEYIDRLLEFGIRNEYVDLNEIKLYLTKDDYKDILLRNLEDYDNTPIKYDEIEDFIKNELEGE